MVKSNTVSQGVQSEVFSKVVWPFAIAETLLWATYFYSFPAFLPTWEQELGFSKTELTGAFTLSLTVSAILSPVVGRLIDKGYGRLVFSGAAALAAVMLILLSNATDIWHFYAIWFGIGIAMSGSLYDACFAIVTYSLGKDASRAITLITLVAGFAGALSFPTAHFLTELFGWRTAIFLFAFTVATICLPLIEFGSRYSQRQSDLYAPKASKSIFDALGAMRAPAFWLIGLTFFLLSLNHGIIISHMLSIFHERGLGLGLAILVASLIGPMQVVGRAALIIFEKRVTIFIILLTSLTAMFVGSCALYFVGVSTWMILIFVVAQGSGFGVITIIRPTVIAELLGRSDFGVVAGLLAMGFVIGTAIAPIFGSLLWQYGGYDLVIGVTIFIPLMALLTFVRAWRYYS